MGKSYFSSNDRDPEVLKLSERFRGVMIYIRFYMKSNRKQLLVQDEFALVSEMWNVIIENCISNYKPGEHMTIDE